MNKPLTRQKKIGIFILLFAFTAWGIYIRVYPVNKWIKVLVFLLIFPTVTYGLLFFKYLVKKYQRQSENRAEPELKE